MTADTSRHYKATLLSPEGEFLVKKLGFGREFGSRLTAKLLLPQTKLPPNSIPTHNFLTKNSPSENMFSLIDPLII